MDAGPTETFRGRVLAFFFCSWNTVENILEPADDS